MIKFMEKFNKIWMTAATIILILGGIFNFGAKAFASELRFEDATHVKKFYIRYRNLKPGDLKVINDQPVICLKIERNITKSDDCENPITLKQWLKTYRSNATYIGFKREYGHVSEYINLYYYLDNDSKWGDN